MVVLLAALRIIHLVPVLGSLRTAAWPEPLYAVSLDEAELTLDPALVGFGMAEATATAKAIVETKACISARQAERCLKKRALGLGHHAQT